MVKVLRQTTMISEETKQFSFRRIFTFLSTLNQIKVNRGGKPSSAFVWNQESFDSFLFESPLKTRCPESSSFSHALAKVHLRLCDVFNGFANESFES